MFIEDDELRTLYRDASKDHLDKLEAGFLHLEKNPDDLNNLNNLLRAAHSLKGDSRMLGVQEAETLTHQIEDLLSGVEKGERDVTPAFCDCLYQGLDAIRKIAHEAFTGEASNVSVFHVMAQLINAGEASDPIAIAPAAEERAMLEWMPTNAPPQHDYEDSVAVITPPVIEEQEKTLDIDVNLEHPVLKRSTPDDSSVVITPPPTIEEETTLARGADLESPVSRSLTPDEPQETTQQSSQPETVSNEGYHIDTIRVEATRLDTLMTQASELAVTKRRITRRMDDIDQVLLFWENWVRDSLKQRLTLNSLENAQSTDQALNSIQALQQTTDERLDQLGDLLKRLRNTSYEDSAQLETLSNDLESGILKLRQVPLSSMFNLFPRMVRDLARQQRKSINLVIEGEDIQADKRILEEMKAPLNHLIRNAIDHGIEAPSERLAMDKVSMATICIKARQRNNRLEIEVIDDGRGLSLESIKRTALQRGLYTEAQLEKMDDEELQYLIFTPGFSTRTVVTEISGRGVGLDVVRVNVERLKGTIQIDSTPGRGCTFRFTINTSLATESALIVEANQASYAIPVESIENMIRVIPQDIFTLDGNPAITFRENPLSVAWLTDLLGLPVSVATQPQLNSVNPSVPCVVLKVGPSQLGIFVDSLIDQQDIVLKPHSKLLKQVRNISGATILGSGEVCMVLSPQDLIKSSRGEEIGAKVTDWDPTAVKPKVLLVEDSIPIRTQVRRILEGAGYQVTTAVDGLDGFNKLQTGDSYAAVVSDVEMPNLSGLELTTRIRQEAQYEKLPIILVTTLAKDEDKQRGADAGANAYITKGDFDQSLLLTTLRSLI
ncbi:chemotaxis protein histidine kinase-like protein [Leptolyngbya sp. PCC 7375]|nr:chemotaxis protein histidine kinase-like protein [Leptolyngbya sp. PCC 7375]